MAKNAVQFNERKLFFVSGRMGPPFCPRDSCRIFDASPSRDPSCNGALHLPGGMSTNPAIRCHCQGHTAGGVGHMTSGPNDGPRGTNDAPK